LVKNYFKKKDKFKAVVFFCFKGKSTLSEKVKDSLNSSLDNEISIVLSYDKILDKKLETEIINDKNDNWKWSRSIIQQLIHSLTCYFQHKKVPFSIEDMKVELNKDLLQNELFQKNFELASEIMRNFELCIYSNEVLFKNINKDSCIYLIIDDIFYYESMRHSFYQMAVSLECIYFNLTLKSSNINFLFERNSNRPKMERLSEEIIKNIWSKFEYPHSIEWERNISQTLDTNELESNNTQNICKDIKSGVQVFKQIIQKMKDDATIRRESREANKNIVHKTDLIMRKIISNELAKHPHQSKSDKSNFAKLLNERKNSILKKLKTDESFFNHFEIDHLNSVKDDQFFENKISKHLLDFTIKL
jgi:tRNA uridine 5-carbamoylmethylation protein Kti12